MNEEQILETLKTVVDPEIGINIVDMGLIYNVDAQDNIIHVEMTMTTPTCPLHTLISQNAGDALRTKFPSAQVEVAMVWDPPWAPEMMSVDAKRQLGWN